MIQKLPQRVLLGGTLVLSMALSGCNRQGEFSPVDMWNRSRYKALEPSPFFADGSSSRPLPPGTVWRGQIEEDALYPPGEAGGTGGYAGGVMYGAGRSLTGGNVPGDTMTPAGARNIPADRAGGEANTGPTGDYRVRGAGALVTRFPFPVSAAVIERGRDQYDVFCAPCHGRTGEGNGMIVQRGFSKPPSYHEKRLIDAPVGHYFDVITNGYGAMYSYASRISPRDRWAITAYIRTLQYSKPGAGRSTPATAGASATTGATTESAARRSTSAGTGAPTREGATSVRGGASGIAPLATRPAPAAAPAAGKQPGTVSVR